MPEIFRQHGFLFYFFSREHEPIHVHVRGNGGIAKFVYTEKGFELLEYANIKQNDLKKISEAIDENEDIIVKRWDEYFNQ